MTHKLAFVVSSDYSELGMAVSAARSAGVEARVYLPEHQRSLAACFPAHRIRLFRGTTDLLAALSAFKPTHLMLFSGYLFLHEAGPDLAALLAHGRAMKRPPIMATTDPFLGLLQHRQSLVSEDFQEAFGRLPPRLVLNAVALQSITHLYPGPTEALAGPQRRLGFRVVDVDTASEPSWLFVLGEHEAQILIRQHDKQFVVHTLVARLREAHAAGCLASIYAPTDLAMALSEAASGVFPIDCRPYGDHAAFNAAVDSALQAFYWNWSSSSLVRRLTTGRPVTFFGRGHVSSLLPGISQRLIHNFHGGRNPPEWPWSEPIDIGALQAQQARDAAEREALANQYKALPPLQELVKTLA